MKTLCCFLLLTFLPPAFSEDGKAGKINIEFLCQHWMHSGDEEQDNKTQVYRPANFKEFPPSRARTQYLFAKDGTCKWTFASPVDAHHFKNGTWKIAPADEHVLQIVKGKRTESYKVIALTKDLLMLKPVAAAK